MRLPGLSAVVTGGASGLGEAVVRALRQRDVAVAIFDANATRGRAIAAETGASFFEVDVCSEESVSRGFEAARAAQGAERILVCCAGVGSFAPTVGGDGAGGLTRHPMAAFERVLAINLAGTYRCITQSAELMAGQPPVGADGERGVIVCTGSIAATDGSRGQAAYSASKAAIEGMTLPVARDLAGYGIRIVTIHPGAFGTPLLHAAPQPVQDGLVADSAFPRRMGLPDEFAALALHICENAMFNGATLRLDAALRMNAAQSNPGAH